MRAYYALFFWFFSLSLPALAQQPAPAVLNRVIASLQTDHNYVRAKKLLLEVETKLADDDVYHRVLCLYWLGECLYQTQDGLAALETTQRAERLAAAHLQVDTLGLYFMLLQNLGVMHAGLGQFDQQWDYYQRALQVARRKGNPESQEMAQAYFALANGYYARFQVDSTLLYYDSAAYLAKCWGDTDLLASLYLNQAVLLAERSDYSQSISYQKMALAISQEPNEQILGYNNLSDYYYNLADYNRALIHLDQAWALIVQNPTTITASQFRPMIQLNYAKTYLAQGDTLRYAQTIEGLLAWLPADKPDYAENYKNALNSQALLYLLRGQPSLALETCTQALAVARQKYPYLDLGAHRLAAQALQAQGCFEEGLAQLQSGLQLVIPDFRPGTARANPKVAQIDNIEMALGLLALKGGLLTQWGKQEGGNAQLWQEAFTTFQVADSLFGANRRRLHSPLSRTALGGQVRQVAQAAIELGYLAYSHTRQEVWLDRAFNWMEKSRSLLLTEQLYEYQAKAFAGVPPELLAKAEQYAARIDYLRLLVDNTADEPAQKRITQELLQIEQRWLELLDYFAHKYPTYYDLKFQLPEEKVRLVAQRLLSADEMMLSFFEADTVVYLLVVGQKDQHFARIHVPAHINRLTHQLREQLQTRSGSYYANAAIYYQLLLAPTLVQYPEKNLVVIPDGVLWYTPFEALVTNSQGHGPPYTYLLEQRQVRYLFSAHYALVQQHFPQSLQPGKVVGVAPGNATAGKLPEGYPDLPPLTAGRQTQERLSHRLGKQAIFLWDDQANKQSFLQQSARASVLLLDTHAELNDQSPLLSRILFTPVDSLPADSALLYAYQIYQQRFTAELGVMAACSTGDGQLHQGEGLASLAHAFAYAGCSNLVVSQWRLSDEASGIVQQHFYELLFAGQGKASALRAAKLAYLSDQENNLAGHPYYWAGLVLLGNNAPLQRVRTHSFDPLHYGQIGGLLSLVVVLILLRREWIRRRKRQMLE